LEKNSNENKYSKRFQ